MSGIDELKAAKEWLKRNQSWPAATIGVDTVEELVRRLGRLEQENARLVKQNEELDQYNERAADPFGQLPRLTEQVATLTAENEAFRVAQKTPDDCTLMLKSGVTALDNLIHDYRQQVTTLTAENERLIERRDAGEAAVREIISENTALTAALVQAREALEHAFNTITIEWLRGIRHETTTETGARLSVEALRAHLASALAALGEPREEK